MSCSGLPAPDGEMEMVPTGSSRLHKQDTGRVRICDHHRHQHHHQYISIQHNTTIIRTSISIITTIVIISIIHQDHPLFIVSLVIVKRRYAGTEIATSESLSFPLDLMLIEELCATKGSESEGICLPVLVHRHFASHLTLGLELMSSVLLLGIA